MVSLISKFSSDGKLSFAVLSDFLVITSSSLNWLNVRLFMDLLIGNGDVYGLFGFLVVDFLIGDGDSYGLFGFLVVDFLIGDGDSYGLFDFLVVSFFGQNLKTCPEPPQFLQI